MTNIETGESGIVYLEHGPIEMILQAEMPGSGGCERAVQAAKYVVQEFEELVTELEIAKRFISWHKTTKYEGRTEALRKMIQAVKMLEEEDFTPMAAVAGAIADIAVKKMKENGAEFALANNGGDIAFSLSPSRQKIRIGLISDLSKGKVTHRLVIEKNSKIKGIATSGFGGRSLTKGVASAVTIMAQESALADAAATSIANACNSDDPHIERCLAQELDYGTDLKGETVTKSIGRLSEKSAKEALDNGSKRAEQLCSKGMIEAVVMFVGGQMSVKWNGTRKPFEIEEVF